jgi:DNA repair photolyase
MKQVDSWFLSAYGMNLYRGCAHNCSYCDGRAESYYAPANFASEIEVKSNAIEILDRELNPSRKRKQFERAFILLGGGVNDSYQPAEKKYELTKKTLDLLLKYGHAVHILTRSPLAMRDSEIIKDIYSKRAALFSMSFSTADDKIASIFEPNAPSPSQKLKTIEHFRNMGIPAGIFLMPVIPFITDTPKQMDLTIKAAKDAGAMYVVFGGMTLKEGRQKEHFMKVLSDNFPELAINYDMIYNKNKWGNANSDYYNYINSVFDQVASHHKMPKRINVSLTKNLFDVNTKAAIILEHLDYIVKLRGQQTPYLQAARKVRALTESIESIHSLRSLNGVGTFTAKILREIIDTGTSTYYEKNL